MNFVEIRFFAFFALVLGVHWALRGNLARKLWLLVASYAFYGAWDWRFLGLILGSTVLDWIAGKGIHASERDGVRRAWLGVSLAGNLGILGFFKYYNWFAESAAQLLNAVGLGVNAPTLAIILPVGISFYTFQTLSYSLDIYFRRLEPAKSFLDLATFVAFFPQLVAGPIVRAVEFLPQLEERRRWSDVSLRFALVTFLIGFVKKAILADGLAPFADGVFADPSQYSRIDVWLGMLLFHVQLYCDFSGYSDMAIGTAGLLGYRLPNNFNFPYFVQDVTTLWQRWHTTLGRWLTDYVYIPLGGSRCSQPRNYLNLVILFTTCGLWHGASWNFVMWGFLNGLVLVIERMGFRDVIGRSPVILRHLWVHAIWFMTLSFFRTATVEDAAGFLRAMYLPFAFEGDGRESLNPVLWLAVIGFLLAHWAGYRGWYQKAADALPGWAFAVGMGAAFALVLPWVPTGAPPFIYFQF